MTLCEGMQDFSMPPLGGPWTPTNGVIPADDELLSDSKQKTIYLDGDQPETHHPSRNKLEPKGNSPHVGALGHVQPNTD